MLDIINVSIVTYKTDREELEKCLKSLSSLAVCKIYIVDNSPTPQIGDVCAHFAQTDYIFNNANIGFGAAHNIAIRRSIIDGVKYHLVLNSDVYFDSNILEPLCRYMEENNEVGELIPRVIYPNGDLQYVSRMLPTPFNLIGRRFLPKGIMERYDYKYLLKFNNHKNIINAPYNMGCFMLFRVSALQDVGLFDERYFMYPEDIDITRRMHSKYKTIYYPRETIVHAHRAASYKNIKMLYVHATNMIKYFNKWGWFFDRERKEFNAKLLKDLKWSSKK